MLCYYLKSVEIKINTFNLYDKDHVYNVSLKLNSRCNKTGELYESDTVCFYINEFAHFCFNSKQ